MNAIPWYRSQVVIAAVVSIVSQVLVIAGKADLASPEVLTKSVEAIFQVIALLGGLWTLVARMRSKVQPVTLNAEAAQEKNSQAGFARAGALGLLLGAALTVAACGVLLPAAKTWNERLASGYSSVTAVREATSSWVDAKVREAQSLPEAERTPFLAAVRRDAENVQRQADEARTGLDIARSLHGIDVKTAEARLVSTLRILEALQSYLEGR